MIDESCIPKNSLHLFLWSDTFSNENDSFLLLNDSTGFYLLRMLQKDVNESVFLKYIDLSPQLFSSSQSNQKFSAAFSDLGVKYIKMDCMILSRMQKTNRESH